MNFFNYGNAFIHNLKLSDILKNMEDTVSLFMYENEFFMTFYSKVTVQLSQSHLVNLRNAVNGIEFIFHFVYQIFKNINFS